MKIQIPRSQLTEIIKGKDGQQGPQGPQGGRGEPGPEGARGVPGEQGIPGRDGLKGPQGPIGPEGKQGPMGMRGDVGPAGPKGKDGKDGKPGKDGAAGPGGSSAGGSTFTDIDMYVFIRDTADTDETNPSFRMVFPRRVDLYRNLKGSIFNAGTAATAESIFDIQKNSVSVGSITFAAAATDGTATFANAVDFKKGDVLEIFSPATVDATLANISFTLVGQRR